MSFDVFLQPCRQSNNRKTTVNPFTGQLVEAPACEPLSGTQREAVQQILVAASACGPDESDCRTVTFSDGSSAEVFLSGLTDSAEPFSGMLTLDSISLEIARFLYSLAWSANLAILPVMEGTTALVISTDDLHQVEGRWPDARVVSSADELFAILEHGFEAWSTYRDRTMGPSKDSGRLST